MSTCEVGSVVPEGAYWVGVSFGAGVMVVLCCSVGGVAPAGALLSKEARKLSRSLSACCSCESGFEGGSGVVAFGALLASARSGVVVGTSVEGGDDADHHQPIVDVSIR